MGNDSDRRASAARASLPAEDPLWFKDAIVYEVPVKAFFDANDDGIGDFAGLSAKLDYIQDLGANTLWLPPFYPSPQRDDGFDVADFDNIDPAYGTREDFGRFVQEAHRRGLRVICEFVLNHTSDRHPWFEAARRAPAGSDERDFYVWSADADRYAGTRIILPDAEKSNWAWDETAQSYYWHRFHAHQPDLNFDNPRVRRAVFDAMRTWLDLGVDGFRLAGVPYLVEHEGTSNENLPETLAVVKELRAQLDAHYRQRVLLADASQWPEDAREYFGNGDGCHMAHHFALLPRMYMAIAQEDRHPLTDILRQTPDIPEQAQWALFLRSHDELTREIGAASGRDYLQQMYATDARARSRLGVRRRLAPLMENDRDRIKLINSLMLSLRGAPIIYYGDEIGMGDDIDLGHRDSVRTPMQWSAERSAGFSRADPQRLYLAPIADPQYGYAHVNVEAQARDPSSLLTWMRRILALRKSSPAFARGRLRFLGPRNRKIFAYLREYGDEVILCVANFGRSPQAVELDLTAFRGRVPVELFGRTSFPPLGDLPYLLMLPAHGFYWFRLATDAPPPDWYVEHHARADVPGLVLFEGWDSFFPDRVAAARAELAQRARAELENSIVPSYLMQQRWCVSEREHCARARIADHVLLEADRTSWLLALVEDGADPPTRYFLPLALAWDGEERHRLLAPAALAKVRQRSDNGSLADAFSDPAFCHALIQALEKGEPIRTAKGALRFARTTACAGIIDRPIQTLPATRPLARATNTVVTLGNRLFLKAYRHLGDGVNPEVDIGRYLTEVVRFPNAVPLAGVVEYAGDEGRLHSLAMVQAFLPNQGDGWTLSVDYVARQLEAGTGDPSATEQDHAAYLALAATLGTRTAELHAALAQPTDDPAFAPEPLRAIDLRNWAESARGELQNTLGVLAARGKSLSAAQQVLADRMLRAAASIVRRIDAVERTPPAGQRTRLHGDYHLGQVLVVGNDFVLMDFEGRHDVAFDERRRKSSPLRDVATMLRSFDAARQAALLRAAPTAEAQARLAPGAQRWMALARRTFLAAYRERARATGIIGADDAAAAATTQLIHLFELTIALADLRTHLEAGAQLAGVELAWLAAQEEEAPRS